MKKITCIVYCLAAILNFYSAPGLFAQTDNYCGTDEMRKKLIAEHPEILEQESALEEFTQQYIAEHSDASFENARSVPYVIPVVFHIIHDYGTENISDEQVYDAIERMNEDYSKTNPDFSETIAEFTGIAADAEIEFRLAQKNLGGGCVNGIDRIPSYLTYAGSDAAKLNPWQPGYYLNIWVVREMPAGVAAYAYYPSSIMGIFATVDGIICRYDYVGSIGAASIVSAHTLSHEAGHYLNLQHPWGNTNAPGVECGDDQVPDTPETKGWLTCNLSGAICNPPIIENVQNFMEYSYCSTMFTEKQKLRMYGALNGEDGSRSNLWQPVSLELTGTTDGYIAPLCTPVADFYSNDRLTCEGTGVIFHDVSWNAPVDSRTWTFEGGSPSSSTDAEPEVSFTETGWHNVTLTVSNDAGSDTKDISDYIYISPESPALDDTYFGDFNDAGEAEANWIFYNKYNDENFWQWRADNGYEGGCAWLNSNHGPVGDKDELITPAFNLSETTADNIYFKYSTTTSATFFEDIQASLKMYYSTNCGESWIFIPGTIEEIDLMTSYAGYPPYYPGSSGEWRLATFDLPTGAKMDKVKFKIEYNYDFYSNNLFIDDFNFKSSAIAIQEYETNMNTLTVSPNPVSPSALLHLQYNLREAMPVELVVYDITGNAIASFNSGIEAAGNHDLIFDPALYHLTPGCYVFKLGNGQNYEVRKVIIE
ncbi:MAG: PKD domain-containing protein [Chitinophagales bacterium]|nr:PKD domain-containing protein [Chitinophagales bacterium]